MKLPSGKRLGQSGSELVLAVILSFLFHTCLAAAAFLMKFMMSPKVTVPLSYEVKLVSQPTELTPSPTAPDIPPAPKQEAKPKAKKAPPAPKKAAPKAKSAATKKGDIPDLVRQKQKPVPPEPKKADEASVQTTAPAAPAAAPASPADKGEGVAVGTTSKEFKFPPYLAIIREKIERNWNPPPGAREMKVKVLFKILRSGRVSDTKLDVSSGNFYFDQAAMRAILSSSPFPPLPEGFFREYEVFSVDLMEKD